MRKILQFSVLFWACGGLFAQNVSLDQAVQTSAKAVETGLPKGAKAAVLTFTSTKQAFSDYIIDELATALAASKNIQVIDRQHTDAIRKEFNIQFSGDVSDEEVKRAGRQLGAQYVVTGSLVDIGNAYRFRLAAINIESAVREGSSSLNININDPQVTFLLTGQRTTQTGSTSNNSGTYKIGNTGPGGGIIFAAEGNSYWEVSRLLGDYTQDRAVQVAKDFRGGGYNDWYLPSREELNMVYQNLVKSGIANLGNGTYWSSSTYIGSSLWIQRFSDGDQTNHKYTYDTYSVRAVRSF